MVRYPSRMTEFRPGIPLPNDPQQTQERQLYHAQRPGGTWATMLRDENSWQWRSLRGGDYGAGGWNDMQK